jgi:gamma-tubulin complex component 3
MSTRSRSPSNAASGRPDAALSFPDLHSKLSVRARPASLWLLLYLLDSLSSQYRAATASFLPKLPIAAPPRNATSRMAPDAGGRPGSRAHGLVIDETEVSEATPA